jgi:ADP-ribose pyrophosphatase YjhB (NUDIX family)
MGRLPSIDDYPPRLSFRFCPLCATPLERRQIAGRERLACPADGWVHFPTPNLAATMVIEHAGGVVLLKRAIPPDVGIWHLPIGHLEFGEAPEAGALREAEEESGLRLEELAFLDLEYSPAIDDPHMFYLLFCYRARASGGELKVDAENSAARVFLPDELPAMKWSSQRRALAAWRAWKAGQPWTIGQALP